MGVKPTIACETRGSRRIRLVAPLLVTLGLAAASIIPSVILG